VPALPSGLLAASSESTAEPSDGALPRFSLSPGWSALSPEALPWLTPPSLAGVEEDVG
jgi:hypothetical protein